MSNSNIGVNDTIYEHWMNQRYQQWIKNEKIKSMSYQEGWRELYANKVENAFTQFMNRIFVGLIKESMETYKKKNL